MRFVKRSISIILMLTFTMPLVAGPLVETLSAVVLNWDGTSPDRNIIQFPVGEATVENPWVHSRQYLRVTYSSDESMWGIRIITNNKAITNAEGDPVLADMAPKILGIGPGEDGVRGTGDDTWRPGPDGVWDTSDDIWGYGTDGIPGTDDDTVCTSFGGLIDPATKNNPDYRADIAWQVFRDPVSEPDPIYYASWGSWYGYWNVGSNPVLRRGVWRYPYEWAYVVDWDNKWNGGSAVGGIYYDPQPPEAWNVRYEFIITGDPFLCYLTQYPPMQQTNPDIRPGDRNIAIYIAACFGIMKNNQCVSILPAGNYSSFLYVQLIHE